MKSTYPPLCNYKSFHLSEISVMSKTQSVPHSVSCNIHKFMLNGEKKLSIQLWLETKQNFFILTLG